VQSYLEIATVIRLVVDSPLPQRSSFGIIDQDWDVNNGPFCTSALTATGSGIIFNARWYALESNLASPVYC
jgi:hypothetical protein